MRRAEAEPVETKLSFVLPGALVFLLSVRVFSRCGALDFLPKLGGGKKKWLCSSSCSVHMRP